MHSRFAVLVLAGVLTTLQARAAPEHYDFDKVHTQILFFVNHLGFSNSQGEFHDYDGGFVFDPDDWGASSVDVTVRTHSIDMDDHAWDKHLRDKDFFDVEHHPTLRFRSLRVERTGDKTGRIHGDLTLLGVTQPVALDVTFNRAGEHFKSKKWIAGFSATGRLKRSDYGMKYGLPFVGDDVELRLEVEGVRR